MCIRVDGLHVWFLACLLVPVARAGRLNSADAAGAGASFASRSRFPFHRTFVQLSPLLTHDGGDERIPRRWGVPGAPGALNDPSTDAPDGGRSAGATAIAPSLWAKTLFGDRLALRPLDLAGGVFKLLGTQSHHPPRGVGMRVRPATTDSAVSEEARLMERMRWSGNVVEYLGSVRAFGKECVLMSAVDQTLQTFIFDRNAILSGGTMNFELENLYATFGGSRWVPLNLSLPILIDLLRAIRDLEAEDIALGELTEGSIMMQDGRPLIADFTRARVVEEDDIGFGRVGDAFVPQDPFRLAPESVAGYPVGPSNNVWAVGAVFATMALGRCPLRKAVFLQDPSMARWSELPDALDRISAMIRANFSIHADERFQLADWDIRELLAGMLDRDSERRWSALGALRVAEHTARERGIVVPSERERRGPPGRPEHMLLLMDTD